MAARCGARTRFDDVRLPAVYEVACRLQAAIPYDLDYDDDQLDAMAALWPALVATAWQMWPSLRNNSKSDRPVLVGPSGLIAWAVRTAR